MTNDEKQYEHITKTLAIDPTFGDECKKLAAEGWEVVPGTLPVAVYHLRRPAGSAMVGHMKIDESGISIIKGNNGSA